MQKLLQGKSPNTSVRSGALIHRPGPVRIKTPMSDKYLSFADLQISKRRFLLTVHWNCRTHWRPSEQAIKVRELVGTDGMKGVPLLYYNLSFLIGGGVLLHGTLKKKKDKVQHLCQEIKRRYKVVEGKDPGPLVYSKSPRNGNSSKAVGLFGQEVWDYRLA